MPWPQILLALAVVLGGGSSAGAHEGPPFAILMDKPAAGYLVSVWADPDIGEATFYIVVEAPAGGPPADVPAVSMWAEPVSGRLDRATYPAKRQALRNRLQFEMKPHFDQRDMWTVGFRLVRPGREPAQLMTQIESTPPGTGPWDLVIYIFPFLLFGGLWAMALVRRYRARHEVGVRLEA